MCNLTTGGTNPEAIQKLLDAHLDVRHLADLHAKVVVGNRSSIVGSANFSTNGLNVQEEEFAGWQEAGYETRDPSDIAKMQGWFEFQWGRGVKIDARMMDLARQNWLPRFKSRVTLAQSHQSVLSMNASELRGRDIALALWREGVSDEARETAASAQQQRSRQADFVSEREWGCFENWPELTQGKKIISAHVGARGGVTVEGVYELVETVSKQRTQGPEAGESMTIHIGLVLDELLGLPFALKERLELSRRLRAYGLALPRRQPSAFLPLEDLIEKI